jgi:membrane protease YdiL (CAAX protease family)
MADTVPATQRFWTTLRKRPDPLTSIAFTVPVFLLYHLGILLVDRRSKVDFISTLVLSLLDASIPAYVMTTLGLTLVLLLTVWVEQKRGAVPVSSFGRVLVEALACALLVLISVGWVTHQLLRSGDSAALSSLNPFEKLVLAAGTGFHEEFIFRALLITGGSALIGRVFRVSARVALILAVLLSSILFSLAHNIGPLGEPFVMDIAGYRVLEGLAFAVLYLARGFAVAVYAHTFYEALVYFVYA